MLYGQKMDVSCGVRLSLFTLIGAVGFVLVAYSSTIHYLGDAYPTTSNVEMFYDEQDVKRPYTTIGQMTHDKFPDYSTEKITILSGPYYGGEAANSGNPQNER